MNTILKSTIQFCTRRNAVRHFQCEANSDKGQNIVRHHQRDMAVVANGNGYHDASSIYTKRRMSSICSYTRIEK